MTSIKYADLRRLLLDLGFQEATGAREIAFRHAPSDTIFVFRPYRPSDAVATYNVMEVQDILDARGLMSATAFDDQFRKRPA